MPVSTHTHTHPKSVKQGEWQQSNERSDSAALSLTTKFSGRLVFDYKNLEMGDLDEMDYIFF